MGRTPDRHYGVRFEEALVLERIITLNVPVESTQTFVVHNPELAEGVTVDLDEGAEMLLL